MIGSFEEKWREWSVDDTVEWFEFVLNTKGLNLNDENYSSSDDDEDEDNDETEDKKQEINEDIDFKHVKLHLSGIEFNAKEDLPVLVKPFQFKRFGFKNKKDCKLLCKNTKLLMKKYPKKRKKSKKNVDPAGEKEENTCDSTLEGFVQDTH